MADKLLWSIAEFADATSIGQSMAKRLIRDGRIRCVRIGDRKLIPAEAARDFIRQLEAEAAAPGQVA